MQSGKWAAVVVILSALAWAQANPSPQSAVQPPNKVLQFLSGAVSWYRQLAVEQKLVTQPSDLAFIQENRRVADQVVELAFDYARNQAQLQAKQSPAASQETGGGAAKGLTQAAQKVDSDTQQTQSEIRSLQQKLAGAPEGKKPALEAQMAETQSELGLLEARKDAIESMVEFVNASSTGPNAAGLRAQIEELARSVPPALRGSASGGPSNPGPSLAVTGSADKPQPSGIWGLTADVIRLSGKGHTIDNEISSTSELEKAAGDLSNPLVDSLRDLVRRGDQLFSAADTAGPAQLAQEKQQLDWLTAQFKQTSAGLLPLSKLGVLLKIYQTTLKNWRESVHDEERDELRQLLLRVSLLLVLIAVVVGGGEVWRRATFRYVHDARRRYQFLLLRRIAIWIIVGLILALTFATQLGSVVTFAGLLTAGVAVALQNVIVSVVGYFFLIGKYGIRVGDRVQIAGVTGEVVEIGLVRIHLMELGGPADSQPTGRIVAFSNSIVFQPTAGVFKQIPGTNFVWHEVKLTLSSATDYHTAHERITAAVETAFRDYREELQAQRRLVEQSLGTVAPAEFEPRVRLHYTGSGMEATVRFPVELRKAAEIDDRVMRALLATTEQEPKLQLVSAGASPVSTP
jgi:small-conductance mechanosensitive channel